MRYAKFALPAVLAAALLLNASGAAAQEPPQLDLTKAVILSAPGPAADAEGQAVVMLKEEILKRTGLTLADAEALPDDGPAIVLASRGRLPAEAAELADSLASPAGADGYAIKVMEREDGPSVVAALGNDARGVLFAAGRLLRELRMRPGRLTLPRAFEEIAAPKFPMRGHQLGYRPKANSYDMWDVPRYEQYIRDLAVFGTNAIELIPSFAMDDREKINELMPVDPWEMTVALPGVIARYGLEVWFWLPNKDADITRLSGEREALANRERLFRACERLDGVFVPGGDPGDLPPEDLMPFLEKMSKVLKSAHPNAGLWLSHQGFKLEWRDNFYRYLKTERPRWLDGVVYGPWAKDTLAHTRASVPQRYAVRRYPDITHTVRCQYPVPMWDDAFARTLERECINPRPRQSAHIHNVLSKHAVGFISYSDGVNDDVNKIIWSAMAWDPEANVRETLVQYGRYFIGPDFADDVADGLLMLERNWEAPLLGNEEIAKTLAHWQAMEKRATPEVLANWRFQQGLFRAYADAYVQRRLERETQLEQEALAELREAMTAGPDAAMAAARQVLGRTGDPAPDLRARLEALADDLLKSIGMQLSVEKHGAQGWERGAVLTTIDTVLNNRAWMEAIFDEVQNSDLPTKLEAISRILNWEDPGPGGFYDDLGNPAKEPHLIRWPGWYRDPGFVLSPKDAHGGPADTRLSWRHQAEGLYGAPIRMHYDGLDPEGRYEVHVLYAGRYNATMALAADRMEVHGPVAPSSPPKRIGFPIPRAAVADGALDLVFTHTTGRGPQVAEVWLIKR